MLAIKLMRTGAKKRPSYRVVVRKSSPSATVLTWRISELTIQPASRRRSISRPIAFSIGLSKGAQPTDTVARVDQTGREVPGCGPLSRNWLKLR